MSIESMEKEFIKRKFLPPNKMDIGFVFLLLLIYVPFHYVGYSILCNIIKLWLAFVLGLNTIGIFSLILLFNRPAFISKYFNNHPYTLDKWINFKSFNCPNIFTKLFCIIVAIYFLIIGEMFLSYGILAHCFINQFLYLKIMKVASLEYVNQAE